jgi:HAD superfamily hydrolase (TIGR01458 family)
MSSISRPFIRAILIDLSGTIHIGNTPTPNAVQALQRLRRAGVPFRFCSNTSKESTEALCERLTQMGFEISSEGAKQEVWTSIGAVKQRLEDASFKKPYFLLSNSAREECSRVADPAAEVPYDSVVVGLAPDLFTYDNLNTAFRVLVGEHESQRSSAPKHAIPFIATHKAKYIRSSDGALSLGPGPFVTALENASGSQAAVVGKPSREFFETVIRNFHFDEHNSRIDEGGGRIAVIGDDVEADLGEGAVELGLWRILVKTGKYRPKDELRQDLQPPDEVHESIAAFVDDFLGM